MDAKAYLIDQHHTIQEFKPLIILQDAKDAFRDQPSSPKRRREGSPKRRKEGRTSDEMKRRRVQEAMKGVEAQLQKTFLVKIFKNQQDLLSLEQVAIAEENQKRRATFRAKQLEELEKRKLDCRVRLLKRQSRDSFGHASRPLLAQLKPFNLTSP